MKTPEEMAEEYADNSNERRGHFPWRQVKDSYLAGYQAAKDEFAIKLKEANDTIDGMADECEGLKTIIYDHDKTNLPTSAKWISVKERLPEDGVGWCTVYGCILSRWSVQPGFYDRESKEWVSRFIGGYMDDEGYAPFESVIYWMPLPEPPEEK